MADAQAQIGFEQLGLGAVLKRYRLMVPPNQRDYAWTDREVGMLFEDLASAIADDEVQYFLGTIVTIPRANGVLEVVDGQQRLATTSLILAAMRHIADQSTGNLSRALENYLVDVDNNLEISPKMRLNSADTAVFHGLLQNGNAEEYALPNRDSHQRLISAYRHARQRLRTIAEPFKERDRTDVYLRWMNYIEYNAKVILLVVPNNVNAFKMFETLNDRGLKTSQSDLVKNYIFGQAGDNIETAQQLWSYIKGSLETVEEEDITVNFLRQALIARHGYLRESEVYEKVQSVAKGTQTSVAFLSELEILAGDYVSLFNADSEKWNSYPAKLRRALRVLNLFDIKPFRPLLLSIARRFSPKEAASAFEKMVSYGVRLIIAASTRSGSVEQPLAKAAKQIYGKEIETAAQLFKALRPIIPTDDQFRSAFETASVSQAKFSRYYLRSVESAASSDGQPWFIPNDDPEVINLEHVLPQKPSENWPDFDAETVKLYSRRLGNQALLQFKANSDLRSAPFEEKRPVLAESPYLTTKLVANCSSWGPQEIAARQKELAALALTAWPL